jgi:hypothetical protein
MTIELLKEIGNLIAQNAPTTGGVRADTKDEGEQAEQAATEPPAAEAKFEGKVVVIIDYDAGQAESTRISLAAEGFDKANIYPIIITDFDINAIEFGALGVTQEFATKLREEIGKVLPGKHIDLIINNIRSETLKQILERSEGLDATYIAGPDWQSNWEAIARGIGESV